MFLNVCKQTSRASHALIWKSKRCFNVTSSTYCFHRKTKTLTGFPICISVTLKSFFVLKIFQVSCWVFDHAENGLIRNLIKIYGVTLWLTNSCNTIHILPNILRSKGNQTLKFSQLIEYNRNILVMIKWIWWAFSKNFQFDPPPTIRHKRVGFILCQVEGYQNAAWFSLAWSFFKKHKEAWN